MKICVLGRGVLADAVASGCAEHFNMVRAIRGSADAIWVCHETPVSGTGEPNIHGIIQTIVKALRPAPKKSLVIVSSQLRVGTTKALEAMRPDLRFVHIPENVRVATASEDFRRQARIVVGRRNQQDDVALGKLLRVFTDRILWTDPETAELCKHAMNGFLALQVAYINELEILASVVRADVEVVSRALLTDNRVSPLAPLKPGAPYAPWHLGREVCNLETLCRNYRVVLPLIQNIAKSNRECAQLNELWP